jgi:hypothetical protein
MLRATGDEPQIYQTLIANLFTWKTTANGLVGDPFTSEKFTACRIRETEHSGFNLLTPWRDIC